MTESSIAAMGTEDYVFANWSKTFTCKPELYFEPTTTEDVKKILEEATKQQKKVKVVGSGYSPSDITCTSGFMVSLKKYNKILNVNKEKLQVTAQAGITLHELGEELREHGMALSLLPAISGITLAGAIATGTHGTGAEFGVLATSVVNMTLLSGKGEVIHCSKDENEDIFNAARCHLGAMGVILDITWQCETAYKLCSVRKAGKLDQVLDNLDSEVTQSDHFKFTWWPHTDDVAIYNDGRTQKPIKTHTSWFWDYLIGFHLLQFLYWLRSLLLTAYFSSMSLTGPFQVEVRFSKGDDIYMSPAYGHDSCFINIIMYCPYGKFIPREDYWNFYEDLVLSVGGRPHWAKAHKLGPGTLHSLYPRFDDFRNICIKLDPERLFINEYLQRTIFCEQ